MADDDGLSVIVPHGDAAEDLGRHPCRVGRFVQLGHLVEVPIGDCGETTVRDDETMQRLRRDLVACVEGGHCPFCRSALNPSERSPEGVATLPARPARMADRGRASGSTAGAMGVVRVTLAWVSSRHPMWVCPILRAASIRAHARLQPWSGWCCSGRGRSMACRRLMSASAVAIAAGQDPNSRT
jgi:hypothetical protein